MAMFSVAFLTSSVKENRVSVSDFAAFYALERGKRKREI
jgi:hypothetical protein